jgi:hypothetical protein
MNNTAQCNKTKTVINKPSSLPIPSARHLVAIILNIDSIIPRALNAFEYTIHHVDNKSKCEAIYRLSQVRVNSAPDNLIDIYFVRP